MIIPKENERDLKEVPDNIKEHLNIRAVKWIDEVLDMALEKMPEPLNNSRRHSAAGFSWSAPPLPRKEIERRVNSYLEPYHDAVSEQLRRAKSRCGAALLLSSHTFPEGQVADGIDVVIGTRHGQAASLGIRSRIEDVFSSAGLRVALEEPFAGGLASERHGRPTDGVSAVQIEIRRSLLATAHQEGDLTRFAINDETLGRFSALMASLAQSLAPIVTTSSARTHVSIDCASATQALQPKSP